MDLLYSSFISVPTSDPIVGTQIQAENPAVLNGMCNFTLSCSVTSGDPTSFKWWRKGEVLGNDNTHHILGHGEMVDVNHTGEFSHIVYKCEARNQASEGTAEIQLKDICKQTTSGELQWGRIGLVWTSL